MGLVGRKVRVAMGIVIVASSSWAASGGVSNGCTHLQQQLAAMQRAQNELLFAMVNKNDSLALVLETYAKDFEAEDLKLKRTDIDDMHNSANAFRGHRNREKTLVDKFSKMSHSLILKTNECLAKQIDQNKVSRTE